MKNRTRNSQNSGFTLVEVLATVGILVILLGIAMVGVVRYVDSLKIAELDNAAREIYMAAENRAALLSNAQRMDNLMKDKISAVDVAEHPRGTSTILDKLPAVDSEVEDAAQHNKEELLYVVSAADLGDLLPYGNIDPTLLDNGDFYIVYKLYMYRDIEGSTILDSERKPVLTGRGDVTDVFYAEKSKDDKTPLDTLLSEYSSSTNVNGEADSFAGFYEYWAVNRSTRLDSDHKSKLLVGWYSGMAEGGSVLTEQPYIDVVLDNGEELTVTVTVKWTKLIDPAVQNVLGSDFANEDTVGSLKVMLGDVNLMNPSELDTTDRVRGGDIPEPLIGDEDGYDYIYSRTWVLDSLMGGGDGTVPLPFKDLGASGIILGGDFTVTATISPGSKGGFIENTKTSDKKNSLFQEGSDNDKDGGTAYICYLRHLQNLSAWEVYDSGVNNSETGKGQKSAVQTRLIWGVGNTDKNGKPISDENGNFIDENGNPTDTTRLNSAIYANYNFVSISNENLITYDGRHLEIRNLNVNYDGYRQAVVSVNEETSTVTIGIVPAESALEASGSDMTDNAGLFRDTSGTTTLQNIRLVNTTVEAKESGVGGVEVYVGALVGLTDGTTTIDNCWVYWDDLNALAEGPGSPVTDMTNTSTYQIVGPTAGGLVGQVNGTTTITESLAATLVEGTGTSPDSSVGGLVGQAASGSSLSIEKSYADCYLTGTGKVAGLVGDVETSVTLTDCYAVGFIMDGNATAGLCFGSVNNDTANVYSAMLCRDDSSGSYKAPSSLTGDLTHKFGTGANIYYLGSGRIEGAKGLSADKMADLDMGSSFAAKTEERDNSHPYNLLDFDPELDVYPYPGLKNLPHYNDWGALDDEGILIPYGLAYYETYDSGKHGIYGVAFDDFVDPGADINIDMTDDSTILEDGYAVAFLGKDISEDFDIDDFNEKVTVSIGEAARWEETTITVEVEIEAEDEDNVYTVYLWIGDSINGTDVPEDCFYDDVSIDVEIEAELAGVEDAETDTVHYDSEYFFNPHFAKTVILPEEEETTGYYDAKLKVTTEPETGSETDPDPKPGPGPETEPGTEPETTWAIIRTPRHLYYLREKAEYYSDSRADTGYMFKQELNLDLAQMGFYADYNYNGGSQTPIGGWKINDTFNGSYNGDSHTISGLLINDSNGSYQGLFGHNTGTIENVILENGEVTGGVNVGGIVGFNRGAVDSCTVENTVTVSGDALVGGIAGNNVSFMTADNSAVKVLNCKNYGSVSGTATYTNSGDTGGIVGQNGGEVSRCENYGKVTGKVNVGGVVGYNNGTSLEAKVTGCVNGADGTVMGDKNVGGIVGSNAGTMGDNGQSNTNSGNVIGNDTSTNVGGIAGLNSTTVDGKYNQVTGGDVKGGGNVGGFVGENTGTVENCDRSAGTVTANGNASKNIGGIVGKNSDNGQVLQCANNIALTANGGTYVGGIVGENSGGALGTGDRPNSNAGNVSGYSGVGGIAGLNSTTVDGNYNKVTGGEVKGSGDVGGFVGTNTGTVENCARSVGTVTAQAQNSNNVGGIVGNNTDSGKVYNCKNTKDLNVGSQAGTYVGGIAGRNSGTLGTSDKPNTNSGNITGYSGVGGIVGWNNREVNNDHSSTGGTVTGTGGNYIGGVVGYNSGGTITGFANTTGNVSGGTGSYVGGIVGYTTGPVTNCYRAGGTVSGASSVGGVAGYSSSTVNGDNHATGGTATGSGNNIGGVVGEKSGGTVQNFTNTTGNVSGTNNVGGIVGYNTNGTVSGCTKVSGAVTGSNDVGGIVGRSVDGNASVTNCQFNSTSTVYGSSNVGGVAGYSSKSVTSCQNNTSSVSAVDGSSYVGGIVGWNDGGTVSNSHNNATNANAVVGHGVLTGGIVGYNTGRVENCNNATTGNWSTYGASSWVGGIVGWNSSSGTVTGCNNNSKGSYAVAGAANNVGGIAGENDGTVENCNNNSTGDHAVNGSTAVGGIVGYNTNYVYNSHNNATNTASVYGLRQIGGIVGLNERLVSNCNNNGKVLGNSYDSEHIGGIVGTNGIVSSNSASVTDCKNYASIGQSNMSRWVGGIVGYNYAKVNNCENQGTILARGYVGGIVGQSGNTAQKNNNLANKSFVTDCKNIGNVTGDGSTTSTYIGSDTGGIVGQLCGGTVSGCTNTGTIRGHDVFTGGIVGKVDRTNGGDYSVTGYTNGGSSTTGRAIGQVEG